MADVRSMLRNERAARRITHPQAQYTPTGALICKACRIQLKSDALWQSHIASSQHITSLKNLASGLMAQSPTKGTKRKADDDTSGDDDGSRKRTKAGSIEPDTPDTEIESKSVPQVVAPESPTKATTSAAVDEDEWAAFEREIAQDAATNQAKSQAQVFADATISATPLTAAELAARSKENEGRQDKERRDAEIEDEKEEAQRRLEEEFDEMDELEARVRRLKDQREALRLKTRRKASDSPKPQTLSTEAPDDDDGDSEDDYWDDWGGR